MSSAPPPPPPPPPPSGGIPTVKKFEIQKKPESSGTGPSRPANASSAHDELINAIKNRGAGGLKKVESTVKREEASREPAFQLRKTSVMGGNETTVERKVPEFLLAKQKLRSGSVVNKQGTEGGENNSTANVPSPTTPTANVSSPARKFLAPTLRPPSQPLKTGLDGSSSTIKPIEKTPITTYNVQPVSPLKPISSIKPIQSVQPISTVKPIQPLAAKTVTKPQEQPKPTPQQELPVKAYEPPPPEPEPVIDEEEVEEVPSTDEEETDDVDERAQEAIGAFGQAQKLVQQKDYDTAIAQYDVAVKATADIGALREIHAKSLFMRGQTKKIAGDVDGAIQDFSAAIKNGKNVEAIRLHQYYNARANALNQQDKLDEAIKDYNKVIKLINEEEQTKPGANTKHAFYGVHHNRGLANLATKRLSPAIEDFNKALSYLEDDEIIEKGLDTLYQLARAYHLRHDYDSAIEQYKRVTRIDAEYNLASYYLGHLLFEKNQHEEAAESFSRAIDKEGDDFISLFNRGMCHKYLEKHSEGLEDFERVTQIKPEFSKAHVEYAKAIEVRDGESVDQNRMMELYDLAVSHVETDPFLTDEDAAKIYFERAVLLNKQQKFEEAVKDFTSAISRDDQLLDAYFNRGIVYSHELKQYEEALADFDRVLNIDANDVGALIERGILFLRTDHLDKALQDFLRAQAIEPDNAAAQKLIDYSREEQAKQ